MKEVWNFYNKSYKHRTQTRIQIDSEEEKRAFMAYWNDLYQDPQKENDMRLLKDYMNYNYLE